MTDRNRRSIMPTDSKDDAGTTLVSYLIAIPVCAWCYVWENYVLIRWPISYWQWVALTIAILIACKMCKPLRWVLAMVGAATLIGQVAAWLGLLQLPLIRIQ